MVVFLAHHGTRRVSAYLSYIRLTSNHYPKTIDKIAMTKLLLLGNFAAYIYYLGEVDQ